MQPEWSNASLAWLPFFPADIQCGEEPAAVTNSWVGKHAGGKRRTAGADLDQDRQRQNRQKMHNSCFDGPSGRNALATPTF
jgi:hypothetical protein